LRYDGPKKLNFLPPREGAEEEEFFFDPNAGPTVLPGNYKLSITVNGKIETQSVQVETDPRFKLDPQALQAQLKLGLELRDEVSALDEELNRLNSLHRQITSLEDLLGSDENEGGEVNVAYKPVLDQARSLDKKITAIEEPLYNSEIQPGSQDDVHYLERFHSRLQSIMRSVMGGYGQAPNELQIEEANEVHKELQAHLTDLNNFLNTEVAAFNKTATEHGSSTLFAGTPIQIKSGAGAAGSGSGDQDDNNPDNQ
jgi:small-conductance mechanosensitive channel